MDAVIIATAIVWAVFAALAAGNAPARRYVAPRDFLSGGDKGAPLDTRPARYPPGSYVGTVRKH